MNPAGRLLAGLLVSLAGLSAFGWATQPVTKVDARFFKERVAGLLEQKCLKCHNPDRSRGSLDLSRRSTMLEGGDKGPAIVPGDATKGTLLGMVTGAEPKMPRGLPPLSATEVADLKAWIDGGAPWPEELVLGGDAKKEDKRAWWAWQAIKKPDVPGVKNAGWAKNEIDRFILSALESKGLTPSTPADRTAFIRRATFDLHGLPPTLEEIDAFVNDKGPGAVDRLIDRLLASPRYGERWGRHWLDIVHYADTHGYDKDKRRLWAWLYRDWVIRAFNQDMPYRRFLKAQIAGDVLFPEDPEGPIAVGFVAAGPWDFVGHVELREGTVDKEKTRNLDRDDMLSNTLATFNSVTVHCARCHDHKFDPISVREYYRLQSVFAGVERGDRPVQPTSQRDALANLEKRRAFAQMARDAFLRTASVKAADQLVTLNVREKRLREELAKMPSAVTSTGSPTNGYHSAIEAKQASKKWVQVDLGQSMPIDFVRLVPARPTDFPDTPGFGFPLRYKVEASDVADFSKAITLIDRTADDVPNPGDNAVIVHGNGKSARFLRVRAEKLWKRTNDYVFALAELQVVSDGRNLAAGKPVTALDSIEAGRWSRRHLVDRHSSRAKLADDSDPKIIARWKLEAESASLASRRQAVLDASLDGKQRTELRRLSDEAADASREIEKLRSSTFVYSLKSIAPRSIHVLQRGDVERKGDVATPAGLALFPPLEKHFAQEKDWSNEGRRRAALANWLADDDNPLTWRSIVNRVWQYHFGKGLVDTPNDFGRNGSRPSHPELLDWLAADFRSADSLKRLHRLIMTSATYAQSSAHRPEAAQIDADNRLLWRMNRTKLDAESIRDSVLAVSGKLDFAMFGPGFEPFRFKEDHSPIYDHLDVDRINAPDTWRRTVYRFVVRSVPNPFLDTLDCADPNVNVPMRNQTLTPLQSLALLNNPFMVRQAEFFADRVQKQTDRPDAQADYAFRLALGRSPRAEERTAFVDYSRRFGLANGCRLLLNANEFLFVD